MPAPLKIVITDCDLGEPERERQALEAAFGSDYTLTVAQCKTADEVIAVGADADALIVQWAPVTREVVDTLESCKIISRYGIGTDMIDLAACSERGIEVRNVAHYCTEEVGTHAAAMLLSLWRRLPQLDRSVRAGEWNAGAVSAGVCRVSNSTLGLIGAGRIAAIVAAPLRALGATIVSYDPYATEIEGVELVSLAELAERSNLVSLHCPLTAETRHIVNADFLAALPDHAVLANTARGDLIDADALADALHNGILAGAGLDVFTTEPLPIDSPLRDTPNTILAPHAAWCSVDALPSLQLDAAANIVNFFQTATHNIAN